MKHKSIAIPGFAFAGVSCGIKERPRAPDLALIYCPDGASAAGVFTKNRLAAPPVRWCRDRIRSGRTRLVVVNSGNANAATGPAGVRATLDTARHAARLLGIPVREILVCSTGRIGAQLPLKKLKSGIFRAARRLSENHFHAAGRAILTTDAYPKTAVHHSRLGRRPFTIAVMAKGAGMIRPDMATMLCFILTDLNIPASVLRALLKEGVAGTLNALSVDGDTSTNDTVLFLASGRAGNPPLRKNTPYFRRMARVLGDSLAEIAALIARDGEGASKCATIRVKGAVSNREALRVSAAVGNSNLVKTALFGCDPNWGRIAAAAGNAGVKFNESELTIAIGPHVLFRRGLPVKADSALGLAARYLRTRELVDITLRLGGGPGTATYRASDLTHRYVRLNAEYRT